jgi:hypothetical protein
VVHARNAAPSSEHSKPVTPTLVDPKPTPTVVPAVLPSTGPETICVSGSTGSRPPSTVQVRDAGDASIRDGDPSKAATVNVCTPSARPTNARDPDTEPRGPADGHEINTTPSNAHSNPDASTLGEEYPNTTDEPVVDPSAGPASITVSRSTGSRSWSTVHDRTAGVASTRPNPSPAATVNR